MAQHNPNFPNPFVFQTMEKVLVVASLLKKKIRCRLFDLHPSPKDFLNWVSTNKMIMRSRNLHKTVRANQFFLLHKRSFTTITELGINQRAEIVKQCFQINSQ